MKFTPQSITEGELLLIDKPLEWTSFQVVNKIRWALKRKFNIKKLKVGHAGTLDPLATGLLIICTGKMTKKISEFQDLDKTYIGTITLGATTPSFDLETPINKRFPLKHLNKEKIIEAKKNFIGTINQYPPIFSAIKKKEKDFMNSLELGRKLIFSLEKLLYIILNLARLISQI